MDDKNKKEIKMTMDRAISLCNEELMQAPLALNISVKKNEGRFTYGWDDTSAVAKSARVKIKKLLQEGWNTGAYNYEYVADRLRVPLMSVQGIMDRDFRQLNGVV